MRIAILAPTWETVPPPAYGGIELVVSLITEGLVQRGHDVTLFATGSSQTSATLHWTQAEPFRTSQLSWYHCQPREMVHALSCLERAHDFDVIHNHMGYLAMLLAGTVATPMLTTLHGPFDPYNHALFAALRHLPYASISDAQRQGAPEGMNFLGTVYNGIDTAQFQPGPKGDYLLNLGRISPEKGTHLAAEAAHRTGMRLIIAGKVDAVDRAYYEERVRPLIDGDRVSFIGEVGGRPKAELLSGARALLHPVQWPEPFGLVMPEAMASGTPVIAFPHGSIPEVVEPGLTGYVVDALPAMCDAIAQVDRLDPATCRRRAVERFDAGRMTVDYEALYERLVADPVSPPGRDRTTGSPTAAGSSRAPDSAQSRDSGWG